MAGKEKEMYSYIFNIYSDKGNYLINTKSKKEKARRMIKRHYFKEFRERDWNTLSDYEKLRFACINIKKQMLIYVEPSFENKIESKIERLITNAMIEAESAIRTQNLYTDQAFKVFCTPDDDDDAKERGYNLFCETLKNLSPDIEPLPKDKWFSSPIRVYDWIMSERSQRLSKSIEMEESSQNTLVDEKVTRNEIDHILIQILLKERKNKRLEDRDIDITAIEKCLYVVKNHYQEEFDPILIEVDDSLPMSEEKQKKIIAQNKQYLDCLTQIEKLDFYTK